MTGAQNVQAVAMPVPVDDPFEERGRATSSRSVAMAGLRWRAAFRVGRVGLHLAWAIATVALLYPWLPRPAHLTLKRRWSRQLLGILGVRRESSGELPSAPCLLVANHVSWLDIFVINALVPTAFVCKAEVRRWPVVGWLCAHTETVFLPRGSRRAARQTATLVAERLAQGRSLAVFPEGTTSDGTALLPFHAALLQGALDAGMPLQPLALTYFDAGGAGAQAAAYCGETSLLQSIWRIAAARELRVLLQVLPVIPSGADRRILSAVARSRIADAIAESQVAGRGSRVRETPIKPGFAISARAGIQEI